MLRTGCTSVHTRRMPVLCASQLRQGDARSLSLTLIHWLVHTLYSIWYRCVTFQHTICCEGGLVGEESKQLGLRELRKISVSSATKPWLPPQSCPSGFGFVTLATWEIESVSSATKVMESVSWIALSKHSGVCSPVTVGQGRHNAPGLRRPGLLLKPEHLIAAPPCAPAPPADSSPSSAPAPKGSAVKACSPEGALGPPSAVLGGSFSRGGLKCLRLHWMQQNRRAGAVQVLATVRLTMTAALAPSKNQASLNHQIINNYQAWACHPKTWAGLGICRFINHGHSSFNDPYWWHSSHAISSSC